MRKLIVFGWMLAAVISFYSPPLVTANDLDVDGDGFSVNQWDCNDNNPTVYPEAFETCRDGIDQNCDGVDLLLCLKDVILLHKICTQSETGDISDGLFWLLEANGDGRFGMEDAVHALELINGLGGGPGKDYDGDGFTAATGDKDDTDTNVHPGAIEICGDGIDQDCDGADQLCPENLDTDEDGYTPEEGDCNDQDSGIYPGSEDIPGDNIDQDCNGCDAVHPANTIYVNEMFTSDEGGFHLYDNYSVSGGRFFFDGAGEPTIYWNIWNGGSNPSNNFIPTSSHSNYFDDYNVSVETYWMNGSNTEIYGLFLSSKENPTTGGTDYLMYAIRKSGYYSIYEYNDGWNWLDGGYSFLLTRSTQFNKIAVEKEGNNFRFYIDDLEVKRLEIEGYDGGGVGIITSDDLDVAYDNFKITSPLEPTCSDGEFPFYGVKEQNEFVYRLMKSIYLWYDEVPVIDYSNYTSSEVLLEDLVYEERDKWSYITTKEAYESHYEEGKYIGVGFSWRYDQNNDLRVSFVYSGSPADLAGMQRGDKILAVNDKPVSVIETEGIWDTIYGERELGVIVKMIIESTEGTIKILTMEKAWVDEKTVLHYEIIEMDGKKIGYLVFKGFIETSRDELNEVFTVFHEAGIDELILDLRYNGGGRLSVANYLASLIGGAPVAGEIFDELVYNENNQHRNHSYIFTEEDLAISIDRLFIITTGSTASASEAVIVGLKPFMETVLIGETTRGKPVGSSTFDLGDKVISAIQFKGVNAVGEQEFYDGLSPTCQADDGLIYAFGHSQENSLKTALDYILSGHCPDSVGQLMPMRIIQKKIIDIDGFQAEIGAF